MKTILVAGILTLTSVGTALACQGPQPPNCNCDKTTNTWVTNNYTTNNTVNGINGSVSSSSTSKATGGNASATGGSVSNSGNSSANIAKGAVTNNNTVTGGAGGQGGAGGAGGNASLTNSGNATIASGAVQNTVAGGSATIAKGAVQNTVAGGSATIASGAVQTSASASGNGVLSNVGNSSIASGAVQVASSGNGANAGAGAGANAGAGAGANSGDNSNNTTIQTNYHAAKIPVNTAYSAGLTSGLDTCLGSVSAGAQTGILGVTFGTTKVDKNCVTIKRTHLITEFSVPAGCDYMLKNIPGAAEAFKDVGAVCVPPVVVAPAPEVTVTPEPAPAAPVVVEVPVKKGAE